MKKICSLCMLITMTFLCLIPTLVQAKQAQNILILSNELPYIMIAGIRDDDTMDMYLVSIKIALPVNDSTKAVSLKSLDFQKDSDILQRRIETFYGISITNTVYLHMDNIQEDMGVPYNETTFSDMKHMTAYFSKVVKSMKISMIFHASDYLEDDLNMSDYYHLYQMFHDGHPRIRYHYAKYFYAGNQCYPLDGRFS